MILDYRERVHNALDGAEFVRVAREEEAVYVWHGGPFIHVFDMSTFEERESGPWTLYGDEGGAPSFAEVKAHVESIRRRNRDERLEDA